MSVLPRGVLLGAIADDFTGATDLCNTLVRRGMRTVQLIGVPGAADAPPPDADAIVVALKSRTIPAADAVAMSRDALAWLRHAGARQILFKYCSTFDSTDQGNIGPVADALLDALGSESPLGHAVGNGIPFPGLPSTMPNGRTVYRWRPGMIAKQAPGFTIFCPAFPENGRTIFKGYLFVGDVLLSESGMRDHPLTPMRDASLVRVLQRQTKERVGLVQHAVVARGPAAIRAAFDALHRDGVRHAIVDAIADSDLEAIGEAASDLQLITGGSGIALGLPENFRRNGLLGEGGGADALPPVGGAAAVLSGSCSQTTQTQVAYMAQRAPVFTIDPLAAAAGEDVAAQALDWAAPLLGELPVVVSATAPPDFVAAVQQRLGRERAGALVEDIMARVAAGLVERGVRRLVVAGGETSGAVVQALGITGLRIGRQIDPGVPWTVSLGLPKLALALKSGNFGTPDFFLRAFEVLEQAE
jgi:uncharacterized protein YgbK (DUF1537 family)